MMVTAKMINITVIGGFEVGLKPQKKTKTAMAAAPVNANATPPLRTLIKTASKTITASTNSMEALLIHRCRENDGKFALPLVLASYRKVKLASVLNLRHKGYDFKF